MEKAELKVEVATVLSETAQIEFKDRFDPTSKRDWCCIIKDLLALANSGGGCVVFGLNSDGSDAGIQPIGFSGMDPATITNKVSAYLARQFSGFRLETFDRAGLSYPGIVVEPVSVPWVPKQNGNYSIGNGKSESAFYQGMIYFRHGAKSEVCEQADIDDLARRTGESARVKFAAEINNVARLPDGYTVQAVPLGTAVPVPTAMDEFRITENPNAPGCVVVDKFKTHKYRRKEVLARLTTRIPGVPLTVYDVQCVRKVHGEELRRLDLIYEPKEASPHYSEGFVEWVAGKCADNPRFFRDTRLAYDLTLARRVAALDRQAPVGGRSNDAG